MSKEALKKISIDVMNAMAENYLNVWHSYGPFSLQEQTDDYLDFKDSSGVLISFPRPLIEKWTLADGPGKTLNTIINEPGMKSKPTWLYGNKEISELVSLQLSDRSGYPTELGKRVYEALKD